MAAASGDGRRPALRRGARDRVRDAHTARVWTPLDYPSGESYCDAEFAVSRAEAYRLLDVARTLAAMHDAVAAAPTRLARETASRPPRPRSTTASPSAP
ncbi:hypothetical protein [Streptomyces sp. NPDC088131]|uniref:hypothetical protein n=1 Tax=Streptomyces sp. NPDC088131 TaxID=3365826 RepID=UPI0037F718F8